jgi:hypothetical protein
MAGEWNGLCGVRGWGTGLGSGEAAEMEAVMIDTFMYM